MLFVQVWTWAGFSMLVCWMLDCVCACLVGFAGNFDLLVLLRGLRGVIQAVAGCGFLLGFMIALVCGFSGRLVGVGHYLFGVGWDCCCVSGVFLRFFGWFEVCLGGDSGFSVGVLLPVCVCAFWCGFVGFLCLLGISF